MFTVGIGYDIHKLAKERKLIIGGVEIPHHLGLLGHSDADVLTHAIMDAILGAAGLPDIGHFFPNDDEGYRDANSLQLLRVVCDRIENDFIIGNIDSTLICEKPKISPYLKDIKSNIKKTTGCDFIGVKATTAEGMNDEGAEKCISAYAVCLLQKK